MRKQKEEGISKKWELVKLDDYFVSGDTGYNLSWFELMRYRGDKFVWYGVGQFYRHLMNWRGCNVWHGRLPKSPVFGSVKEACEWLWYQVRNKVYYEGMHLKGHFCGDEGHCKACNKETDWLFEERETNITPGFHDILKEKKSVKTFLEENKREIELLKD